MAVANTKSQQIQNADRATSLIYNDPRNENGTLRESVDTVEVAAADDDGSVYRFMRVHSSWRLSQITLFNDAITGASDWDCGLYRTSRNGSAAVDADLFADSVDVSAGTTLGTELLMFTLDVANIGKMLWEALGLSSDPRLYYDLCITANTVGSGAGTLSVRTRFVPGA